jgi:hypothetical protein
VSTYGDTLTFSVTVGNKDVPAVQPTDGTVNLFDGTNTTPIASQPWAGSQLSFMVSTLSFGGHTLTAKFDPGSDTNFLGNTSSSVTQTVKTNTQTTLSSTPNASVLGQSVTITATITRTSATATGSPNAGTVQFYDNGAALGTPQNVSGGTASITVSTFTIGTHPITATYSGDTLDNKSTSGSLAQVVAYGTTVLGNPKTTVTGGSTLPLEIEVTNSAGMNLSSSKLIVTAVGIGPAGSAAPTMPAQSPGNSYPGGLFQFTSSPAAYTFNLKVVGPGGAALAKGKYTLFYTIGNDSTLHTFNFTVS